MSKIDNRKLKDRHRDIRVPDKDIRIEKDGKKFNAALIKVIDKKS